METRQHAVLFVEVADGAKISESLGDTVALALIKGVLGRLEKIAARWAGSVVAAVGDSVVLEFAGADDALRAACEMQTSVNALAQRAYGRLQIKAAFACGPVAPATGDPAGETMDLCARLIGLAEASQILTSAPGVEALSAGLRARCRALPAAGSGAAALALSEVTWRADPAQAGSGPARQAPEVKMALKLIYRANIFIVNRTRPQVQLGRDDGNDIVVVSLFASRIHARVEAREGNYVLTDLSTNGTFLLADEHTGSQSAEIHLHREEAVLGVRGWIGLGKSAAKHGDHSVRFALQPETA